MRKEEVLLQATFDEKLPKYWMASALLALTLTVIGIPFMLVWVFVGWGFHRKQFERLECELTDRSLNIRRGVIFRVEKNIPLDKIQDLAMHEGPLLRWLGLSALAIETAGSSGAQGSADAKLTGVVDAPAFRDAVLNQRDRIVAVDRPGAPAAAVSADEDVLVQIRDSLHRIEQLLERPK